MLALKELTNSSISMFKERYNSFKYAFAGIKELFVSQPNAKIHLFAAICVGIVGWYVGLSHAEWAIITLTIACVIAAEAFNTALEYLTDLVSPEHHPLAGKVKDVAAAGVLITAIGAIIVGLVIFLPKIFAII